MMEIFQSVPTTFSQLTSLSATQWIFLIISLIILWIIVSIPVWLAAKVVTAGRASFGEAMLATLFGPIVFIIILMIAGFFLGPVIGTAAAFALAYFLAFIGWIWVFKASFQTGWLAGLAIAILAILILIVLNFILAYFFGATLPAFFHPYPL